MCSVVCLLNVYLSSSSFLAGSGKKLSGTRTAAVAANKKAKAEKKPEGLNLGTNIKVFNFYFIVINNKLIAPKALRKQTEKNTYQRKQEKVILFKKVTNVQRKSAPQVNFFTITVENSYKKVKNCAAGKNVFTITVEKTCKKVKNCAADKTFLQ